MRSQNCVIETISVKEWSLSLGIGKSKLYMYCLFLTVIHNTYLSYEILNFHRMWRISGCPFHPWNLFLDVIKAGGVGMLTWGLGPSQVIQISSYLNQKQMGTPGQPQLRATGTSVRSGIGHAWARAMAEQGKTVWSWSLDPLWPQWGRAM